MNEGYLSLQKKDPKCIIQNVEKEKEKEEKSGKNEKIAQYKISGRI